MEVETWALVRRLHRVEKLSQREIAEELGIHRETVARALSMESYEPPKRPRRGSILDPFKDRVRELLEEFPRITGVRVLEEIKKAGYPGSLTVVQDFVREIRPRPVEPFARLHFEPGEAFQVDWASCGTIEHEDVKRRLSAFLMLSCYSRMLYLEFTLSEVIEELFCCHVNGFEFFGGVHRVGIYDNPRTVVLSHVGREVRFHPKFQEFAGFYLFQPRACRPRRPQEKGGVEAVVRYLRTSFLSGRRFRCFAEVQAEAVRWRDEVANVRVHRTTGRRPVDLFEEEKAHLRKLPERPYDTRVVRTVKATHQCRVRYEGNTYSVPPAYAGRPLTLRASRKAVEVFEGTERVARHRRSWGRAVDVVDREHERALRQRKRRATQSLLEREFRGLSPEAGKYLEGLSRAALEPGVHVRKILNLASLYGEVEVAQAIARALAHEAYGFEYVENIVLAERRRRSLPPEAPLRLPERDGIETLSVEERNLEEYEDLIEEGREHEREQEGSDEDPRASQ